MTASIRVLLLEDNQSDAELLTAELGHMGYQITWDRVDNREAYLTHLNDSYDLILADHRLPRFEGRQALALLQEKELDIPFIVVTGSIGEEQAAEYIKLGAADYLLKDRLHRLGSAITHALEQRQLRQEKQRAEEQLRRAYTRLESLVEVRTMELIETNQALQTEVVERRRVERSLAEERNLLRAIIDHVPHLIFVRDTQSRFVLANQSLVHYLSADSPEQVIGTTLFDFFPETLAGRYHADDRHVLETGEVILNKEEPGYTVSGNETWRLTTKLPLRDNQDQIVGLIGISQDITERKTTEAILQQYQNDLETLVEARTLELQAANQRLTEEIEERRQAQLALQHQMERAQALAEISRLIAESRASYQAALEAITRRLAELIGDGCVIRLLSEDGLWLQPVSFYHPQPQAAALLKTILAAAHRVNEGIVSRAIQQGQALFLNGIDQAELQRQIKPELQPWLTNIGIHALLVIPLKVQAQIIGALSLSRDTPDRPYTEEDRLFAQELTDRAALAIDNARLQEAVRQHTVELEQRIADRTADLEAFTYSVSHDLRAPLRAISGFSQILARRHAENLNEEGQHYLDNVVRAGAQMGNLINDLLAYSRLGRQGLKYEEVSLSTLLQQVRTNLGPKAAASQATINIPPDLPVINSNWTLLGEIFTNLIDNALTYCQANRPPTVTITYGLQAHEHYFAVADNGIGIQTEYRERIFQAFQRLYSAEEYPGTGIGLAIVKKSVELLGGRLGLESEAGVGSTFWFTVSQKPPARPL